ncbi:MAG: GNVR domain-containing protein [Alphaproteobacteria bacterium]
MWNFRDILSILFKRRTIVIVFFATVCIGALVALKLSPPNYAAVAKVLVKVGREDIYVPALPSETLTRPMMSLIREEQLNSEVEIIGSEYLADLLVDKLTPEGIYPSMFVKHPWYTPKGVMQGLIGIYHWLDGYFAPFSANLNPKQRVMKRLLNKDMVIQGTGDSNVIDIIIYNKVPQYASQTANALLDLYLQERGRIHSDTGETTVFRHQMDENEQRLEEAQDALQEFRRDNDLLDVAQEREALLQRMQEIRTIIIDLKGQASAAKRVKKWQAEANSLNEQLETLSDMELEYARLVQNVDVLKRNRKIFLEKLEEQRINKALDSAQVGNVSVVSRAVPPTTPSSPKLWMILAAMLAVGLFGGLGLAFVIEFLDDTLETDRDVEKYLGVPIIGKVQA